MEVKFQLRTETGYQNLPCQSWAPGISRPDLSDACNGEYDLDPSDPENVKRASLLRLYHITEKSNQNLLTSLCSNCPSVTNLSNLESSPRTQQHVLLRHSNILEHDLSMTTYQHGKDQSYHNIDWQTLFTWKSTTTVLFRTTLPQTTTQDELLTQLCSDYLLS